MCIQHKMKLTSWPELAFSWKTDSNPFRRLREGVGHFVREQSLWSGASHPLWACVITLGAGLFLTRSVLEVVAVFTLALLPVLIEMHNSAVEQTNNRIGLEYNMYTKRAKEMASAATMLSKLPLLTLLCFLVVRKCRLFSQARYF
jgi:diacylglycerol kinase